MNNIVTGMMNHNVKNNNNFILGMHRYEHFGRYDNQ